MYRFPQKPLSAYSLNCSHNFMVKCVDPCLARGKRLASGTAALEQVRWPSQLDWFLSLSSKICFQSLASRRRVCSQNVFHIVARVWFHWHGRRLQNIYRTLHNTRTSSLRAQSQATRDGSGHFKQVIFGFGRVINGPMVIKNRTESDINHSFHSILF